MDLFFVYFLGRGLGRNENGIATALKPKLKFDTAGLGKDQSEQFTHHWWEHAYNSAANNLEFSKDEKVFLNLLQLISSLAANIKISKRLSNKIIYCF